LSSTLHPGEVVAHHVDLVVARYPLSVVGLAAGVGAKRRGRPVSGWISAVPQWTHSGGFGSLTMSAYRSSVIFARSSNCSMFRPTADRLGPFFGASGRPDDPWELEPIDQGVAGRLDDAVCGGIH
jgi:hypothetical protein